MIGRARFSRKRDRECMLVIPEEVRELLESASSRLCAMTMEKERSHCPMRWLSGTEFGICHQYHGGPNTKHFWSNLVVDDPHRTFQARREQRIKDHSTRDDM